MKSDSVSFVFRTWLTMVLLGFGFAQGADSAVVYVDESVPSSGTGASWAEAYKTINEGIQAAETSAVEDDVVWVAEGTYAEVVTMRTRIAVYGGFAGTESALGERDIEANECIINSASYHCVVMDSLFDSRLDGFTITGGNAVGSGANNYGGGIYCLDCDDTNTIANCTVIHNHAGVYGGGMYLDNGDLLITDCRILANTCGFGAGIFAGYHSMFQLVRCIFSGNGGDLPSLGNAGAGLFTYDYSGGEIDQCLFVGNRGGATGGAIEQGNFYKLGPVRNTVISGNRASYGGGIYVSTDDSVDIMHCTIVDNFGSESLKGSGVYLTGSPDVSIVNCLIAGNDRYGIEESDTASDPVVLGCLFHGNSVGDYLDEGAIGYSGAAAVDAGVAEVSGSVDGPPQFVMGPSGTWDTSPTYLASEDTTILWDSDATFTPGALTGKFMNPDTSQKLQVYILDNTANAIHVLGDVTGIVLSGESYQVIDYHLGASSPAIDTGDPSVALTEDLDGEGRPVDVPGQGADGTGTEYDIGAFEYQTGPTPTPTNTPPPVPTPTPTPEGVLPGFFDLADDPGTEPSDVLRIYGGRYNGVLGAENSNGMAFGDMDGDNFDEIIIGAHFAWSAAGQVHIIFGANVDPGVPVDLKLPSSTVGDARVRGPAPSSELGYAVATGDIDNDGLADAVLGAPDADLDGQIQTGEVYIVYGDMVSPGAWIDLAALPPGSAVSRIKGATGEALTGAALACADLNGDGYDDVIIGAPQDYNVTPATPGKVFIIYGTPGLRGQTIDLADGGGAASRTEILGDDDAERFGCSVAAGDVDGDGFPDAIIGAEGAIGTFGSYSLVGRVYIVYGRSDLVGDSLTLHSPPASSDFSIVYGEISWNHLGNSVAAGDVDNDGYADIIAGAQTADTPAGSEAGKVYVVYGHPTFPGNTVDLRDVPGTHGETRIQGVLADAQLGSSVAGGDIDADGYDDVIMGSFLATVAGRTWAGMLQALYGGEHLSELTVISADTAEVTIYGASPMDWFGCAGEAGGDINRDGYMEFGAAGSLGDHPTSGSDMSDEGYAAIIYGSGASESTSRTLHSAAGDVPPTDFGPVARCRIDYQSGAGTSRDDVSIFRSSPPNTPFFGTPLPVYWRIESDRSSFTARVTFEYTDEELGEIPESGLALYSSPDGSPDSWSPAGATQYVDAGRNEITAEGLTHFSYFAIISGPTGLDSGEWTVYR